jgi:hypothetical protein
MRYAGCSRPGTTPPSVRPSRPLVSLAPKTPGRVRRCHYQRRFMNYRLLLLPVVLIDAIYEDQGWIRAYPANVTVVVILHAHTDLLRQMRNRITTLS